MRIGVVSTIVPFVRGGGRFIAEWLRDKLEEAGHQAALVMLPSSDEPDRILQQMAGFRLIELDAHFDRVITLRPPAHVVRHRCKVAWFIHHIRGFYDLWDTEYRPVPDRAPWTALRDAIRAADTRALGEAHRIFTNSRVVGERLRAFNGIGSEVLYPPVLDPGLFRAGAHGDEIVCICRMEHHKRQHLLVEAMRFVRSGVRLRLCGESFDPAYAAALRDTVLRHGLAARVAIEDRWIAEEEKRALLATALAAAYLPLDEDSYGYPTVEAAHAGRATVTASDAGGALEFVRDGESGIVVPPDPLAIAAAFDALFDDRTLAARLGAAAAERITALGIGWNNVLRSLLA
jgi:glycosyltransferase involved in cell wall biosynthesis